MGIDTDGQLFWIEGDFWFVPGDHRPDAAARHLYRDPPGGRGDHAAQPPARNIGIDLDAVP
jgi:hypothetical protein